jgi:hypothetical protein
LPDLYFVSLLIFDAVSFFTSVALWCQRSFFQVEFKWRYRIIAFAEWATDTGKCAKHTYVTHWFLHTGVISGSVPAIL